MDEIIDIDLSDDELMDTILPESKKNTTSTKQRTKIREKYLDKT
jgi:hypothetical protein